MNRPLMVIVLAVLVIAGCNAERPAPSPSRILGPGERWVPVALWELNGQTFLCAGGGFVEGQRLHGAPDDPRLVWMEKSDGTREEVAWPTGFSARFTPELELLDGSGRVVAWEGTRVVGGCVTAEPGVLRVEL